MRSLLVSIPIVSTGTGIEGNGSGNLRYSENTVWSTDREQQEFILSDNTMNVTSESNEFKVN